MSDSKSASKTNLNESNMPLLLEEDHAEKSGETPEKEQIELMTEFEKEDAGNEKDAKNAEDKNQKKKKKDKKHKKEKGPSCIEIHSQGLNLESRDSKFVNTDIDIGFDDVLAEPLSAHGFDGVWKLSFVLFTQTKIFLYRLLSALVAVPAALFWALIFAIITVLYVWILAPVLRIFELIVAILRKILKGVMRFTVEPVASAVGAVFSKVSISKDIIAEP